MAESAIHPSLFSTQWTSSTINERGFSWKSVISKAVLGSRYLELVHANCWNFRKYRYFLQASPVAAYLYSRTINNNRLQHSFFTSIVINGFASDAWRFFGHQRFFIILSNGLTDFLLNDINFKFKPVEVYKFTNWVSRHHIILDQGVFDNIVAMESRLSKPSICFSFTNKWLVQFHSSNR